MKKDIIVLTKSDKRSGYCVAGIDKVTGEWIRVVSSNSITENAVPPGDLIAEDGTQVEVYDIVEIEFIKHIPTDVQPENYLYNECVPWKIKGKSNLREVIAIHGYDDTDYVFENDDNRLNSSEALWIESSLLLLKVEQPRYNVRTFPERKVLQMNFKYKGISYCYFKVTQTELKNRYFAKRDDWYLANTDVFVFSLTDRYKDGRYYKVVAQALV